MHCVPYSASADGRVIGRTQKLHSANLERFYSGAGEEGGDKSGDWLTLVHVE